MSDETAVPKSEPAQPDEETPVGDMTDEGQTELGPYPTLTNVENWEESDIEDAATGETEGEPDPDE